tara:strand:+ start:85 stop:276 length:192 start_codon:yes stop_codon:yes gene_type:complete
MKLDNIEIELEWPKHLEISELRRFIVSNFPKEVEIIRWYIDDIKILNKKTRKNLIKINASILN